MFAKIHNAQFSGHGRTRTPFLSNYETVFVLVSAEWTTLMDHSAASAVTWSNRQLLCLEAKLTDEDKLELKPRIPAAWRITGSANFPSGSLPCLTFCLYDYKEEGKTPGDLDFRLITALTLMAREGDRIGAHGFALLWQDHLSISQTSYNITICGISPFTFNQAMRRQGIISKDQSHLVKSLDRVMRDWDPAGHSGSIFKVAETARPILDEISSPSYEGFSDWEVDRLSLSVRAEPLACEFWGLPGNFARFFTTHPAVRKHRAALFNNGRSDWRDPRIGIPLLESFLAQDAFPDGNVRCSDCFKLGFAIGLDLTLRANLKDYDGSTSNGLYCRFLWNYYRLATLLEEVQLLTGSAKNVEGPKTPYVLSNDPAKDLIKDNSKFIEWIRTEFLQDSDLHNVFFDVGVQGALLFDRALNDTLNAKTKAELVGLIANPMKFALNAVLTLLDQLKTEGGLLDHHKDAQATLKNALGLKAIPAKKNIIQTISSLDDAVIAEAWEHIVSAANTLIDSVYHDHADTAPAKPDWDWLHQGIKEMYERGNKYPAVHLLANGTIVTGPIEEPGINWLKPIEDYEKEVIFCDHSKGIMLVLNTTWEDLKAGKHFAVVSS